MSTAEDRPKASPATPAPVRPFGTLLGLTLVGALRTKRVLLFLAVLALPVAFSLYWSLAERMIGDALYLWGIIFVVAYLHFLVPFAALLYGATLISAEQEARTLTYLVTRPVARRLIVLAKYTAGAVLCLGGLAVSMLLAYGLLAVHFGFAPLLESFTYWLRLAGVAAVALLVYLSVFLFAGMCFRRPVVVGLVFIVAWEGLVGLIPGIIRFVTVMHYLRSLAIHATKEAVTLPRLFMVREAPVGVSLIVLAAVWAFFLALSLRHFTRAELHANPDQH